MSHVSAHTMPGDQIEMKSGLEGRKGSILHSVRSLDPERNADVETNDARPLLRVSDDDEDSDDEDDHEITAKRNKYERYGPPQASVLSSMSIIWIIGFSVCLILIAIAAIFVVMFLRPRLEYQSDGATTAGPFWHGYSTIENVFSFGDSWTDNNFNPNDEQPSLANPIGNPAFPGRTSCWGPNYAGYLATQYNNSVFKSYNLAFSGSVVNSTIDHSFFDWLDIGHQIHDKFLPYYIKQDGSGDPVGWRSDNTLFTSFFGINDVIVFDRETRPLDALFVSYERAIRLLYDNSARNFLIMNIPPIDLAPQITSDDHFTHEAFAVDVLEFNVRVKFLAERLRMLLPDATIFEYDTHTLVGQVIAAPQSIPQTKSYKNTRTVCVEYESYLDDMVMPTPEQIDRCDGLNIDEFLWVNKLHVTWPVHEAIAAGIQQLLLRQSKTL